MENNHVSYKFKFHNWRSVVRNKNRELMLSGSECYFNSLHGYLLSLAIWKFFCFLLTLLQMCASLKIGTGSSYIFWSTSYYVKSLTLLLNCKFKSSAQASRSASGQVYCTLSRHRSETIFLKLCKTVFKVLFLTLAAII